MASERLYKRFMRPAVCVEGAGHARDAVDELVKSMSAIGEMLRCALIVSGHEGLSMRLAEDVCTLMEQQADILAGISQELGHEQDERDRQDEAKGIVSQSRLPNEALIEPAHKLRVEFIKSNTMAGVDPGLIGTALNLSKADVQRVIDRLRGEAEPPAPAASRAARSARA